MTSEPPNVLLTSRRGEEKYLLDDLENLGEFKTSEFRDVVIGWVEDKGSFLSELNSGTFPSMARVVPIEKTLEWSEESFEEDLSGAIRPYADRIETGESFKISFTRRGLQDRISSQEVEKRMGSAVCEELEREGKEPEVDLEDPDKTIVIESLGKLFLFGFLTREMEKEYYSLDFL
ncbi:hypothetical protein AKJ66_01860 [candidate division MSBL1 archaeon SCGC-AAA259E22]|uniref:THUMP domain-containing protein n=1 Tax=candidate division MSBL1 archaeon SCGC-AAA259E22 TaxID=1698265 RepID=A0A133UH39_9EURY|nr:hypothetical protein AKJ66_01860 [candidate division MSBL1 archaeon SCGC-AAA259E22]